MRLPFIKLQPRDISREIAFPFGTLRYVNVQGTLAKVPTKRSVHRWSPFMVVSSRGPVHLYVLWVRGDSILFSCLFSFLFLSVVR